MWVLVVSACVHAAVSILGHVRETDESEREAGCGRLPGRVPSCPPRSVGCLHSLTALGP